jgi:hypothetical protein
VTEYYKLDSQPYGLSYGEWTAKWWQWAYSIPQEEHPAYDHTGSKCGKNQNGPVWFLAGTHGKSVVRKCSISSSKAILFPILNTECSFAVFQNLKTVEQLRECARDIQNQVTKLHVTIDGVGFPESQLQEFRVQSPPFTFVLPENNILGLPGDTVTTAVADGNWVFLKPLAPGEHELSFKGFVKDRISSRDGRGAYDTSLRQDSFDFPSGWNHMATYKLTITI